MRNERFENWWPFSLCDKWTEEMDIAYQGKKVTALSSDKWAEREDFCKENFPWKFWAEDKLDDIRNSINRFIDHYILLEDVRSYYRNRFIDKTHILRTNIQPGTWRDFDTRIFDAIMLANLDYIEDENFHHQQAWADEDKKDQVTFKPWEVIEYEKKERGEPNGIEGKRDGDENDMGMGEHQWKGQLARWEAYNWYKNDYPKFEVMDDELHKKLKYNREGSVMRQLGDNTHKEHNRPIYEEIWALEKRLEEEKLENLIKIITHYKSMWT